MPPLAIIGGIAAAGSIGSAAIGASAAGHAADVQSQASMHAADIQHQDAQAALDFQKQVYGNQQTEVAPWLQTGTTALANLGALLGLPGYQAPAPGAPKTVTKPALTAGNPTILRPGQIGTGPMLPGNKYSPLMAREGGDFTGSRPLNTGTPVPTSTAGYVPPKNLSSLISPNANNLAADPGYQFRLDQGMKALQRSAAAKGTLLTGGTAKALDQFGQDYASQEYMNRFNRLATLAGFGQNAVGQSNSAGSNAAGNVSNILMNSGQQIGNSLQNAGAARASGYVGAANAWGGALQNGTNNLSQLLMLKQMGYF